MKKENIVRWVAIVVLILWIVNWVGVKLYYGCDVTGSGTFGDMFGATNALFSGLTIVGLIYTILLQREQIVNADRHTEDERKRLIKQFEEQKDHAQRIHDAQKDQAEIHFNQEKAYLREQIAIQNHAMFENTFFKMMDLVQSNLQQVFTDNEGMRPFVERGDLPISDFKGPQAIPLIINRFKKVTSADSVSMTTDSLSMILAPILDQFNARNYVTNVSNIYRMINISDVLDEGKKEFYTVILTTNLSEPEKYLIYLSTLLQWNRDIKQVLTKYHVITDPDPFSLNPKVIYVLNTY